MLFLYSWRDYVSFKVEEVNQQKRTQQRWVVGWIEKELSQGSRPIERQANNNRKGVRPSIEYFRSRSFTSKNPDESSHCYGPYQRGLDRFYTGYKITSSQQNALSFSTLLVEESLGSRSEGPTSAVCPQCYQIKQELKTQLVEVVDIKKNSAGELEVLIKWLRSPDWETGWEPVASTFG